MVRIADSSKIAPVSAWFSDEVIGLDPEIHARIEGHRRSHGCIRGPGPVILGGRQRNLQNDVKIPGGCGGYAASLEAQFAACMRGGGALQIHGTGGGRWLQRRAER